MFHLFASVFMLVLGLGQKAASINKFYTQVNKPNHQFISDYATFHKNIFILEVYEENKKRLTSTDTKAS